MPILVVSMHTGSIPVEKTTLDRLLKKNWKIGGVGGGGHLGVGGGTHFQKVFWVADTPPKPIPIDSLGEIDPRNAFCGNKNVKNSDLGNKNPEVRIIRIVFQKVPMFSES